MLVLHINTYSTRVECWYYTLILNSIEGGVLVLHINTYSTRVECWYYTLILIVRGWSVGITH